MGRLTPVLHATEIFGRDMRKTLSRYSAPAELVNELEQHLSIWKASIHRFHDDSAIVTSTPLVRRSELAQWVGERIVAELIDDVFDRHLPAVELEVAHRRLADARQIAQELQTALTEASAVKTLLQAQNERQTDAQLTLAHNMFDEVFHLRTTIAELAAVTADAPLFQRQESMYRDQQKLEATAWRTRARGASLIENANSATPGAADAAQQQSNEAAPSPAPSGLSRTRVRGSSVIFRGEQQKRSDSSGAVDGVATAESSADFASGTWEKSAGGFEQEGGAASAADASPSAQQRRRSGAGLPFAASPSVVGSVPDPRSPTRNKIDIDKVDFVGPDAGPRVDVRAVFIEQLQLLQRGPSAVGVADRAESISLGAASPSPRQQNLNSMSSFQSATTPGARSPHGATLTAEESAIALGQTPRRINPATGTVGPYAVFDYETFIENFEKTRGAKALAEQLAELKRAFAEYVENSNRDRAGIASSYQFQLSAKDEQIAALKNALLRALGTAPTLAKMVRSFLHRVLKIELEQLKRRVVHMQSAVRVWITHILKHAHLMGARFDVFVRFAGNIFHELNNHVAYAVAQRFPLAPGARPAPPPAVEPLWHFFVLRGDNDPEEEAKAYWQNHESTQMMALMQTNMCEALKDVHFALRYAGMMKPPAPGTTAEEQLQRLLEEQQRLANGGDGASSSAPSTQAAAGFNPVAASSPLQQRRKSWQQPKPQSPDGVAASSTAVFSPPPQQQQPQSNKIPSPPLSPRSAAAQQSGAATNVQDGGATADGTTGAVGSSPATQGDSSSPRGNSSPARTNSMRGSRAAVVIIDENAQHQHQQQHEDEQQQQPSPPPRPNAGRHSVTFIAPAPPSAAGSLNSPNASVVKTTTAATSPRHRTSTTSALTSAAAAATDFANSPLGLSLSITSAAARSGSYVARAPTVVSNTLDRAGPLSRPNSFRRTVVNSQSDEPLQPHNTPGAGGAGASSGGRSGSPISAAASALGGSFGSRSALGAAASLAASSPLQSPVFTGGSTADADQSTTASGRRRRTIRSLYAGTSWEAMDKHREGIDLAASQFQLKQREDDELAASLGAELFFGSTVGGGGAASMMGAGAAAASGRGGGPPGRRGAGGRKRYDDWTVETSVENIKFLRSVAKRATQLSVRSILQRVHLRARRQMLLRRMTAQERNAYLTIAALDREVAHLSDVIDGARGNGYLAKFRALETEHIINAWRSTGRRGKPVITGDSDEDDPRVIPPHAPGSVPVRSLDTMRGKLDSDKNKTSVNRFRQTLGQTGGTSLSPDDNSRDDGTLGDPVRLVHEMITTGTLWAQSSLGKETRGAYRARQDVLHELIEQEAKRASSQEGFQTRKKRRFLRLLHYLRNKIGYAESAIHAARSGARSTAVEEGTGLLRQFVDEYAIPEEELDEIEALDAARQDVFVAMRTGELPSHRGRYGSVLRRRSQVGADNNGAAAAAAATGGGGAGAEGGGESSSPSSPETLLIGTSFYGASGSRLSVASDGSHRWRVSRRQHGNINALFSSIAETSATNRADMLSLARLGLTEEQINMMRVQSLRQRATVPPSDLAKFIHNHGGPGALAAIPSADKQQAEARNLLDEAIERLRDSLLFGNNSDAPGQRGAGDLYFGINGMLWIPTPGHEDLPQELKAASRDVALRKAMRLMMAAGAMQSLEDTLAADGGGDEHDDSGSGEPSVPRVVATTTNFNVREASVPRGQNDAPGLTSTALLSPTNIHSAKVAEQL